MCACRNSFYEHVEPARVPAPRLLRLNEALASHLGIDPAFLRSEEGIAVLSGNRVATGSEPIALAYAGHQFGHFVPQLGDGRAVLLGEVTGVDGKCYDMQLKGSGRTRFSRRGDGKAALGPVLREYIVSEAMAALGIPTTRTLAALLTGETVMRERPLPGGVLTRVASSHLRVGTFQYFAVRKDLEALRILTDYAIDRHYPQLERRTILQSPSSMRWLRRSPSLSPAGCSWASSMGCSTRTTRPLPARQSIMGLALS